MKQLALRPLALLELEEATDFYEEEQVGLGDRFSDAVEAALLKIRENPGLGSKRYVELVPGVHVYVLRTLNYLIFYFNHADHIEVIRLLHAKRDLPSLLEIGEF